jgi:phosphoglucosamine mutase
MELAIEAEIEKPLATVSPEQLGKAARIDDAAGRYIEFCKSCFPAGLRLQQLKIVVDCAHGATYHIAPSVFKELGAKVIKTGVEPDGFNINYECGSTSPESLAERVKQESADIGLAFDGDGDRVTIVDERGKVVDGDHILYVIARNRKAAGEVVPGVVGTVMSNIGLELSLKQKGIDFYRADVGDRHVSKALNDLGWTLGGESSGHIICRDKTTTGDGIIAALEVLAAMKQTNQKLSALIKGMKKCPQTLVNIETSQAISVLGSDPVIALQHKLEQAMQGAGRILLRASGTEPLIRVMVQGESSSLVDKTCKEMVALIEQQNTSLV